MTDRNAKKKGKRRVRTYSEELVEFCDSFLLSTEMATARDTFSNWDGDLRLDDLPSDAPKELRESIEAVNKVIAEGQPLMKALVKRLEEIRYA